MPLKTLSQLNYITKTKQKKTYKLYNENKIKIEANNQLERIKFNL